MQDFITPLLPRQDDPILIPTNVFVLAGVVQDLLGSVIVQSVGARRVKREFEELVIGA